MNETPQIPDDRPIDHEGLGEGAPEVSLPSDVSPEEAIESAGDVTPPAAASDSEEPVSATPQNADPAPEAPPTPAPVEEESEEAGDEEQDETPVWVPEPDKLLLSLLFASHEYLDARALREIMGPEWDTPRLRQLVRKLNRELDTAEHPFEITETEGTFRLRTLPKFYPWTRRLFKDSAPRRLSQAALETLAIVAYKQPVTKAEIESIRGVNVDGSMKTLLDKRLIDIGRRSDTLGQAFTYHTTRDFMRYFGISRVPDDLPRLSEFEGILNAQTLIPQMGPDGEVHEMSRDDEPPDAEQLTLGVGGDALEI